MGVERSFGKRSRKRNAYKYVNQLLYEHFSEAEVARELRNSDEYRTKHLR